MRVVENGWREGELSPLSIDYLNRRSNRKKVKSQFSPMKDTWVYGE